MGANATIHVAFLCHPQETKWENFHHFGNKFQIVTPLSCQIPLLHCLAFNFYEIGNDSDEGTHSLYLTLSKVQISAKAQCVWIARGCLDPLGERAGSFILTHLRERSWVASLLLVAAPCPHHLKGSLGNASQLYLWISLSPWCPWWQTASKYLSSTPHYSFITAQRSGKIITL